MKLIQKLFIGSLIILSGGAQAATPAGTAPGFRDVAWPITKLLVAEYGDTFLKGLQTFRTGQIYGGGSFFTSPAVGLTLKALDYGRIGYRAIAGERTAIKNMQDDTEFQEFLQEHEESPQFQEFLQHMRRERPTQYASDPFFDLKVSFGYYRAERERAASSVKGVPSPTVEPVAPEAPVTQPAVAHHVVPTGSVAASARPTVKNFDDYEEDRRKRFMAANPGGFDKEAYIQLLQKECVRICNHHIELPHNSAWKAAFANPAIRKAIMDQGPVNPWEVKRQALALYEREQGMLEAYPALANPYFRQWVWDHEEGIENLEYVVSKFVEHTAAGKPFDTHAFTASLQRDCILQLVAWKKEDARVHLAFSDRARNDEILAAKPIDPYFVKKQVLLPSGLLNGPLPDYAWSKGIETLAKAIARSEATGYASGRILDRAAIPACSALTDSTIGKIPWIGKPLAVTARLLVVEGVSHLTSKATNWLFSKVGM
jgi:hypothetical protein